MQDENEVLEEKENSESLNDWTSPPTLRDLKQDLEDAKPDVDSHISDVSEWLDNLNVEGKAAVKSPKGRSSIAPKLIRKQAEWRYAALSEPFLNTPDVFNVDPITFEDKEAAKQNELVLNNQFNTKINKTKFIDNFVRTAVDEGTVVVKTSWDFYEEEKEVSVNKYDYIPTEDPEVIKQYESLYALKRSDPLNFNAKTPKETIKAIEISLATGRVVTPVYIGKEKVTKLVTVKNSPVLEVCDYRNIVIDPSCLGDIDNAKFVIQSFETSYADLKKDGRYKNLDSINIEQSSILNEPDHASELGQGSFNFSDKPRKRVVAYEYWGYWDVDGSGNLTPIVATWVGDTLIRLEENPFPDKKLPFVVVQYLPVRNTIYGEPDGALLEDNQKILGAVVRGMVDIMGRSANGQTGIRKDALDLTNKRKYDKGEDYEFNQTVDARSAFYMHTFPEIPASAQFMVNMQNQEAEAMTGVKAFSQGITGSSLGNVASLGRGALDAASKRETGILRRLADGVIQIGRKFISMNSEFLDEEEVVRITNENFVVINRDDLAGNFDLRLSISTAEEDNQKAEELAFMLQTTAQSSNPEEVRMIRAEIARLRKMPELAKNIENFQPTPDPITQRKAELEIALLEAQVNKENSVTEENLANAELYRARMPLEGAKARKYNSDADKSDLDFVEQEKGVTQERTLEKMNTQTRGNIALKTIDNAQKVGNITKN